MTRPGTLNRWTAGAGGGDGHPEWCARAHHCTAGAGRGSHASIPEVWEMPSGDRVVATRRLSVSGRSWVEIRYVFDLPADEGEAVEAMRRAVAGGYAILSGALES